MSAADVPGELRLLEEECTRLRRVMAEPIIGFSTIGGSVDPLALPTLFRAPLLVIHCSASILVTTVAVDVAPQDEVFPVSAQTWEPESQEPWWYRPAIAGIDPQAAEGLDLMTPLGRIAEVSVLTLTLPPLGEVEDVVLDTALIFTVGGWRLLVESLEHTPHRRSPMDLALTTDSKWIDERLAQGTVREI